MRKYYLVDSNGGQHLAAEGLSTEKPVKHQQKHLKFTCMPRGDFDKLIPLHTCMQLRDLQSWLEACMEAGRGCGFEGSVLKSPQNSPFVQYVLLQVSNCANICALSVYLSSSRQLLLPSHF